MAVVIAMDRRSKWDSLHQLQRFSKSQNPPLSSFPDPKESLSAKYHESPSGLLIPDALSLTRSQSVRFGDVWSNDWMSGPYNYQCARCGGFFPSNTSHWCSAVVNTTGQNTIAPPLFSVPFDAYGYVPAIRPAPAPPQLPVEQRTMPVIGYRAWKTDRRWELGYGHRARLTSTGVVHNWEPGVNTAKCGGAATCSQYVYPSSVSVPNEKHECGLYVVADVPGVQRHIPSLAENHVVGAVLGWGKVVQHGNEGWRAQYARVIALMDMKLNENNDEIACAISKAYGVPILERDALERYVSEFGDPVREDNHADAV